MLYFDGLIINWHNKEHHPLNMSPGSPLKQGLLSAPQPSTPGVFSQSPHLLQYHPQIRISTPDCHAQQVASLRLEVGEAEQAASDSAAALAEELRRGAKEHGLHRTELLEAHTQLQVRALPRSLGSDPFPLSECSMSCDHRCG